MNYLSMLSGARVAKDFKQRLAMAGLAIGATALPVVTAPVLVDFRTLWLQDFAPFASVTLLFALACVAAAAMPAFPAVARFTRQVDIAIGAVAAILAYFTYAGIAEILAEMRAFGTVRNGDYLLLNNVMWSWGLVFGIIALVLAVSRSVKALSRPLHV
ncbi:hypothetical protein [Aureimonas sp. Leaf460]|uniref:hypothetical protein n=1 Tax=Aureimonas sp. Leaf460 TaxID=1736384 RepID=UPI001AEBE9E2|nr:hypothetical protein [Aureimonas sp. Leaf460]